MRFLSKNNRWFSFLIFAEIVSAFLFIHGCQDEERMDGIIQPKSTEQIAWLDNLIHEKSMEYPNQFYVMSGECNTQNIAVFYYCCPTCQDKIEVYNQDGQLLCTYSPNIDLATSNCPIKLTDILYSKIYWQSGDLDCLFID